MLFIFDWDGTLVDSRNHIVGAMQRAISDVGLSKPCDNAIAKMIGLSLHKAFLNLYPDLSSDTEQQLSQLYSKYFIEMDSAKDASAFFPGAISTLTALRDKGHRLAIATGKSRRGLNRVMARDKLESFIDISRTADETASKPNPLMLQEILLATGEVAENAIMVGDTSFDMAMAEAINMPRVAVSFGMHSVAELQAFKPLSVIDELSELLTI